MATDDHNNNNRKRKVHFEEENREKKKPKHKKPKRDIPRLGGEENYGRRKLEEGWEPFNMESDLADESWDPKTGKFKRKTIKDFDPWLAELDEKTDKDKEYISKVPLKSNNSPSEHPLDEFDEWELAKKVTDILQPSENVLAAMRRLKPNKPDRKRAKSKRLTNQNNVDEKDEKRSKEFDELVELSDSLFARGWSNIYSEAKEILLESVLNRTPGLGFGSDDVSSDPKNLNSSNDAVQDISIPSVVSNRDEDDIIQGPKWEYKWSEECSEVYGPFDTATMQSWMSEGYFDHSVVARQKSDTGEPEEFIKVESIPFDFFT